MRLLLGGTLSVMKGVHRLGLSGCCLLPGLVGILGGTGRALEALGHAICSGLLLQAGLDHGADAGGLLVGGFADLAELSARCRGGSADVLDRIGERLQLLLTLFQVSLEAQCKFDIAAIGHRSASRWVGCGDTRARGAGCNLDAAKRSRPKAA
ncbi:hypothetical protein [Pseudomonas fluvialis]|uniref:hypothetical protein n=1 Tax=Pseudomonas fluvialis TaxID=1793966 RepID=UPI0012FE9467|nr:hypothetical protein [Pseudomonas pharmacofabricae]